MPKTPHPSQQGLEKSLNYSLLPLYFRIKGTRKHGFKWGYIGGYCDQVQYDRKGMALTYGSR